MISRRSTLRLALASAVALLAWLLLRNGQQADEAPSLSAPASSVARSAGLPESLPADARSGERRSVPSRLIGVVLSPAGEPVEGAKVEWIDNDPQADQERAAVDSDAAGGFSFDMLEGSRGRLRALDPRGRWEAVVREFTAGSTDPLVLQFEANRRMQVIVRSAEPGPVPEYALTVKLYTDGVPTGTRRTSHASGSSPTSIRVPQLEFELLVEAESFEPLSAGPFSPREAPARHEFVLRRSAGVRGVVLQAGNPLAGAHVTLHRARGSDTRILCDGLPSKFHCKPQSQLVTGPDGLFFFAVEDDSLSYVHVLAQGFACNDIGPLAGGSTDLGREQIVELSLGGSLIVTASPPKTGADAPRWVGITRGDGHRRTKQLTPEGLAVFERLAPGGWMVRWIEEPDPSTSSSNVMKTNPGATGPLQFDVLIAESGLAKFALAR